MRAPDSPSNVILQQFNRNWCFLLRKHAFILIYEHYSSTRPVHIIGRQNGNTELRRGSVHSMLGTGPTKVCFCTFLSGLQLQRQFTSHVYPSSNNGITQGQTDMLNISDGGEHPACRSEQPTTSKYLCDESASSFRTTSCEKIHQHTFVDVKSKRHLAKMHFLRPTLACQTAGSIP